jgi:pimeloyl-ACP methyl ester carboxylesterase
MEFIVDGRLTFAYTGTRPLDLALPTIVFVHGSAMDHSIWTLQSRFFAHHGHNVLAVDLPGHGRSEGQPLASIGEMADWLPRMLDAAELESSALVGHSMGSLTALEAAARHPDRVRAISLLGACAPMPVSQGLLAAAAANDHAALDMVNIWSHDRGALLGGSPTPGIWMTGLAIRLLERAAPGVLYRDLSACDDYRNGLQSAARVTCPALLILGRNDRMTPPRAAEQLLAAIPGVEAVVLEGCGHMMFSERPDAVLDALIGFL